jgi:hypothetical protein
MGFDMGSSGKVKFSERPRWLMEKLGKEIIFFDKPNTLTIKTLEGDHTASVGDYIIQGVSGELYPCKSGIFEKTYDKSSWKMKIMLLRDITPAMKKGDIIRANIWWDHKDSRIPLFYVDASGKTIPLSVAVRIECGTCKHLIVKTGCCALKACNEEYPLWEIAPEIENQSIMDYRNKNCLTCKRMVSDGSCAIIYPCMISSLYEAKETTPLGRPKALATLNDPVNHPSHYCDGGIEVIDYIDAKGFNYHLGNVIKYVSRAGKKGSTVEDLKKARWYLDREIKILEEKK